MTFNIDQFHAFVPETKKTETSSGPIPDHQTTSALMKQLENTTFALTRQSSEGESGINTLYDIALDDAFIEDIHFNRGSAEVLQKQGKGYAEVQRQYTYNPENHMYKDNRDHYYIRNSMGHFLRADGFFLPGSNQFAAVYNNKVYSYNPSSRTWAHNTNYTVNDDFQFITDRSNGQSHIYSEFMPDGKLESFSQAQVGNCVFLSALSNGWKDPQGKVKLENMISRNQDGYIVRFPGAKGLSNNKIDSIFVSRDDLKNWDAIPSKPDVQKGLYGDKDAEILYIAADKFFRQTRGVEGLHLFNYAPSYQLLFNNTPRVINGSKAHITNQLKKIINQDPDHPSIYFSQRSASGFGYIPGHAGCINHINFDTGTVYYSNPWHPHRTETGSLNELVQGVASGNMGLIIAPDIR